MLTNKLRGYLLGFIAVLAALAVLLWFFPLFHVVSLEEVTAKRRAAAFNASEYAEHFWLEELTPALETATPAVEVLSAIRESPASARDAFGKNPGLGRNYYFFLRGQGTIVSIEKNRIGVSLSSTGRAQIFCCTAA